MNLEDLLKAIRATVIEWILKYDTWVPTFGGFAADPAGGIYRYVLVGKMCTCFIGMPNAGTSNATSFSISLPFAAASVTNMTWRAPITAYDNGAALDTPGLAIVGAGGTSVFLYTAWNGSLWTAAGGKRAQFTITYEID